MSTIFPGEIQYYNKKVLEDASYIWRILRNNDRRYQLQ